MKNYNLHGKVIKREKVQPVNEGWLIKSPKRSTFYGDLEKLIKPLASGRDFYFFFKEGRFHLLMPIVQRFTTDGIKNYVPTHPFRVEVEEWVTLSEKLLNHIDNRNFLKTAPKYTDEDARRYREIAKFMEEQESFIENSLRRELTSALSG